MLWLSAWTGTTYIAMLKRRCCLHDTSVCSTHQQLRKSCGCNNQHSMIASDCHSDKLRLLVTRENLLFLIVPYYLMLNSQLGCACNGQYIVRLQSSRWGGLLRTLAGWQWQRQHQLSVAAAAAGVSVTNWGRDLENALWTDVFRYLLFLSHDRPWNDLLSSKVWLP